MPHQLKQVSSAATSKSGRRFLLGLVVVTALVIIKFVWDIPWVILPLTVTLLGILVLLVVFIQGVKRGPRRVKKRAEHELVKLDDHGVPAPYSHRLSWRKWVHDAQWYIAASLMLSLLMFTVLFLEVYVGTFGDLLLVTVLIELLLALCLAVCLLFVYRAYFDWRYTVWQASVESNVLSFQPPMNRWLFLPGGRPRSIDLSTAEMQSHDQTLLELYLPITGFRESRSITVDGPSQQDAVYFTDVKYFMYSERLEAIWKYLQREERARHQEDMSHQERQSLALEGILKLLIPLAKRAGVDPNEILGPEYRT